MEIARRHSTLQSWLAEAKTLSVEQIAERLGVSVMTVHRDLDALARQGVLRKVHGGAIWLEPSVAQVALEPMCKMCHISVPTRTAFTIHYDDGEQAFGCCPHCGLMMTEGKRVSAALAKDFLYGRAINALDAFYVAHGEVVLCCMPSILCFATRKDAERYVRGFQGEVLSFNQALALVRHSGHIT